MTSLMTHVVMAAGIPLPRGNVVGPEVPKITLIARSVEVATLMTRQNDNNY